MHYLLLLLHSICGFLLHVCSYAAHGLVLLLQQETTGMKGSSKKEQSASIIYSSEHQKMVSAG